MKSRYWHVRSIMLLMVVGQSLVLAGQDKIALLMGVGDYPSGSAWQSTNAYNDLNLIRETLIQEGFNQDFIYTLLDSACTKKGIQFAFSSFLIPKLKEGMFIHIHFSGLAQQVVDIDDDEADGFDVAIVPYDAPKKMGNGSYNPGSFMLDDELEEFFSQIRNKLGPTGQLFVSMDASTAPESLNGHTTSRGSSEKMQANDSDLPDAGNLNSIFTSASKQSMAPMVSFYSSSFNQLNDEFITDENESYGLFSFALCKSLVQLKKGADYKEWFNKLKLMMNENASLQVPVILGDAKLPVFKGNLNGKRSHFEITKMYSKDLVLINAGKLQQIEKGTEFFIYDESVKDTTGVKPIARAIAEDVKLTESDLRILESNVNQIGRNSNVFVSSYHYKPLSIRLKVDLGGGELEQKLISHFSFSPFIKKDALKPEVIIGKTKKDLLQLKTRQGEVLFQKPLNEINISEIPFTLNEKIAEYLRSNFLRNLEVDNNGGTSEIQGIVLKDSVELFLDGIRNKVQVGTKMKIRITNNTEVAQYFSVIDIQPDHQINVLIPFDKPAETYYLEPGQSYTTDFEMLVSPPLGKDVIKVIMMSTPLDLRPVIVTRGVSNLLDTKKVKNPFEIFMGNTFIEHPVTTNGDMKINISEIGSVSGIVLEIE